MTLNAVRKKSAFFIYVQNGVNVHLLQLQMDLPVNSWKVSSVSMLHWTSCTKHFTALQQMTLMQKSCSW